VSFFCLDCKVSSGFNDLTFLLPGNSGLGVASEGNFHDSIFALVKEGRISEPWRNIKPRWLLDLKFSL